MLVNVCLALVLCANQCSRVTATDHIAITATTEAPIPTHTVTALGPRQTVTVTRTALQPQATQTITKHVTAVYPATATATATAPAATSTAVATSSVQEIKAAVPKGSWWNPFSSKRGEIVTYKDDVDHTIHQNGVVDHTTVGDKLKNLIPGQHHFHQYPNVTRDARASSCTASRIKNGASSQIVSTIAVAVCLVSGVIYL